MVQLNREQMISIGALISLLLVCAIVVGTSLQFRSDSVHELAERRDFLLRLGAHPRSGTEARGQTTAPSVAFVDGSTAGLAIAQLQLYLSEMASSHNADLISYGVEPARRDDPPDSIRVQVTLDVRQRALQGLLHQLESGTPYVFVDLLAVQPASTAGQGAAGDPTLRVILNLRALWQRGSA